LIQNNYLCPGFQIRKVYSKEFDIGIELLDGIKTDTGKMKGTLNKINENVESFVEEQRSHNYWMKEHTQRLEKILGKLAES
jgi:hypothetical protein